MFPVHFNMSFHDYFPCIIDIIMISQWCWLEVLALWFLHWMLPLLLWLGRVSYIMRNLFLYQTIIQPITHSFPSEFCSRSQHSRTYERIFKNLLLVMQLITEWHEVCSCGHTIMWWWWHYWHTLDIVTGTLWPGFLTDPSHSLSQEMRTVGI